MLEYGGRLSSVIDISMKDGNNKKFQARRWNWITFLKINFTGSFRKK